MCEEGGFIRIKDGILSTRMILLERAVQHLPSHTHTTGSQLDFFYEKKKWVARALVFRVFFFFFFFK